MTQLEMILTAAGCLAVLTTVLAIVPDRDRIDDQRTAAELSARWRANDPAAKRWASRSLLLRLLLSWPMGMGHRRSLFGRADAARLALAVVIAALIAAVRLVSD